MNNQGAHIQQARTFLARNFDVDPSTVEFVGEGAWSRCFGFRSNRRELVIRFGNYVEDFQKDERAFTHATTGLPIPEVLDIGQADDGYYAVSTRAHGVPLETLGPQMWLAAVPKIASMLEALRLADLSSTRGFGGWGSKGIAAFDSWAEYLLSVGDDSPDKRGHGWRAKLQNHPQGLAAFSSGFNLLKQSASDWVPRSLIHGDLLNRNVLVEGNTVGGVLDWGCSAYGDHLYDLAWFEFWAPWHPTLNMEDLGRELNRRWQACSYTPDNAEKRLISCFLHIGLDHLAYNAFTENWQGISETAERMRVLVQGLSS